MSDEGRTGGSGPGTVVLPCGKCWIELELLDENGEPGAGEIYDVQLANGERREGRLDQRGYVRLEQIPCGECKVRFPKYEGRSIRLEASRTAAEHFLEIELVDEAGKPMGGENYKVKLPDGSTRAGQLGANGRTRLDGIAAGECRVSFPDRHISSYEKVS